MSNFSVFQVTTDNQTKAIACALASTEQCKFQIDSTIGDLINLAAFLRLGVSKNICTDERTVKGVGNLADIILATIKQEYPFFVDMENINPDVYFEALRESNEVDLSEVQSALESLFSKFQQVVNAVDSSDAADE
jgi:hypothetical protein